MSRLILIALIAQLSVSLGCGSQQAGHSDVQTGMALKELYSLYSAYFFQNGRPPANADELIAHGTDSSGEITSNALKQVSSDELIVQWSVSMRGAGLQPELILAYHKNVPDEGGYVCLLDGRVVKLEKGEFDRNRLATGRADEWSEDTVTNTPVMIDDTPVGMLHPRGRAALPAITDRHPSDAAPDTEEGRIHSDVRKFAQAMIEGDVNAVLQLIPERVIDHSGGKSDYTLALMSEVQQRRVFDFVETSLKYPAAPTFRSSEENDFAIVPVHFSARVGAAHIEIAAFKIAIRPVGTSDWKYVDGGEMVKHKLLEKLYPDFPEDVEFPETYNRKVEPAEE